MDCVKLAFHFPVSFSLTIKSWQYTQPEVSCEHPPWSAPQEAGLKIVSIQKFHVVLNKSITSIPASQMSCPKVVTHTPSKAEVYFFFQSLNTLTRLPTQLRRLNCQIAIPSISTTAISHSHQTPEVLHGKAFLQHGLVFVVLF